MAVIELSEKDLKSIAKGKMVTTYINKHVLVGVVGPNFVDKEDRKKTKEVTNND